MRSEHIVERTTSGVTPFSYPEPHPSLDRTTPCRSPGANRTGQQARLVHVLVPEGVH